MIIDFDSHLREGYFMDEVYRLAGPYERFRPVKLNDGRTHNTKFLHSLDPISPQGHAAHRHPYIYDPKTNWRGGDIAARQVGGYDMARRREDLAKEGIDKQLMFPTQITVATSNIGGLGRECARLFNDWVANLVKGHEDVFLPVAMAPAGCPEAMADELRCYAIRTATASWSTGSTISTRRTCSGVRPTAARRWWLWYWEACSKRSQSSRSCSSSAAPNGSSTGCTAWTTTGNGRRISRRSRACSRWRLPNTSAATAT